MEELFKPTLESYEAWSRKSHPFIEIAEKIASRYVAIENKYRKHGAHYQSPIYGGHYSLESTGTTKVYFTTEEDCYDHWATHDLSISNEFFEPNNEQVWLEHEAKLKAKFDSLTEKLKEKDLANKKAQLKKLKEELGE